MGTTIGFDHKHVHRLPKTQGIPFVGDGIIRVDPVYAASWDKRSWAIQRQQANIPDASTYDAIYISNTDSSKSLVIVQANLLCGSVPGSDLYLTLSDNVSAVDDGNFDPSVASPFGSGRNVDQNPSPLLGDTTILEGNNAAAAFTPGAGGPLICGWPLPANTENSWHPWIIPPNEDVGISVVNNSGSPQTIILNLLVTEVP